MESKIINIDITKYVMDTMHLSTVEHGIYLIFMIYYLNTEKPLINDDNFLSSLARLKKSEWRQVKDNVLSMFLLKDNLIHHVQLDDQIAAKNEKINKQKSISIKRSKAAKSKNKEICEKENEQNSNFDYNLHSKIQSNEEQNLIFDSNLHNKTGTNDEQNVEFASDLLSKNEENDVFCLTNKEKKEKERSKEKEKKEIYINNIPPLYSPKSGVDTGSKDIDVFIGYADDVDSYGQKVNLYNEKLEKKSEENILEKKEKKIRVTRRKKITEDFMYTDEHKEIAKANFLDVEKERRRFIDHHTERGEPYADFGKKFTQWLESDITKKVNGINTVADKWKNKNGQDKRFYSDLPPEMGIVPPEIYNNL